MSEQPGSLAAALVTLQGRLPRIVKGESAEVETKTGRKYTYKYVDLASIHALILPLLAELGLYWICKPTLSTGGQFVLIYSLRHADSGDEETGEYPLPSSGDSQALGSAITYARRYCLTSVLGIAPDEDDDGQAAAGTDWRPPANPRTRKADRHNAARSGPLPDDDWTTPGEDKPGSIDKGQLARIHILFTKAGITQREDRLAYTMSKLDLPELATSKDLSMVQASYLISYLQKETGVDA